MQWKAAPSPGAVQRKGPGSLLIGLLLALALSLVVALAWRMGSRVDEEGSPPCEVVIEVEESAIDGGHFQTAFRIELRAEGPFEVYGDYSIRYLDTAGDPQVEPGVLGGRMAPGRGIIERPDVPGFPPAEVLGVEILEASCRP